MFATPLRGRFYRSDGSSDSAFPLCPSRLRLGSGHKGHWTAFLRLHPARESCKYSGQDQVILAKVALDSVPVKPIMLSQASMRSAIRDSSGDIDGSRIDPAENRVPRERVAAFSTARRLRSSTLCPIRANSRSIRVLKQPPSRQGECHEGVMSLFGTGNDPTSSSLAIVHWRQNASSTAGSIGMICEMAIDNYDHSAAY